MRAEYIKTEISIKLGWVFWTHYLWTVNEWKRIGEKSESSPDYGDTEKELRLASTDHDKWANYIKLVNFDEPPKFTEFGGEFPS
jgi:hypothetical protein